MKRILGVFAVALAIAGIATTAQAQRTVTYNRTVDGLDPEGYFVLGTTELTITLNVDSSIVGPELDPNNAVNKITSMGFDETLPTGWTYTGLVAGNPANPTLPPVGNTGTLGFAWITPPATPFTFSFTVTVPGGETGPKTLVGQCNYRTNGGNIVAMAPDTLIQQKPTTVSIARALSGPGITGASNQFYVPGETITVEVTLTKDGPAAVTALGVEETLPAGWTYTGLVAGDPDNPTIPPVGNMGTVGFGWITPPAFPFNFAYNVLVPANETANNRMLSVLAKYRLGGGEIPSNTDAVSLNGAPCTQIIMDGEGGNFYSAGNTKQINVNISETCGPNITALGVYQTLPAGWTYTGLVAGDPDNPTIPPVGNSGTIQFGWISPPAAPFTYSYTVSVPALEEGDKDVSGYIEYRLGGGALNSEGFTLTLVGADLIPPPINLLGNDPETVECGGSYTDAGATAIDDRDGDVSANIVVGGDVVDPTTPGTYVITYDVSDAAGNAATQVTRTVNVEDTTAPSIQLNGNASVTVECGSAYNELGATATDTCDTAVAVVVGGDTVDTSTPGTYVVAYDASDASGNAATTVTRSVEVVDATAPTITRLGAATVTVQCGGTYSDAGATASDACEGNLTGSIVTVNPVNTAVVGNYTVTYNVSDGAGNAAAQVTRTVTVADTTAPVITRLGAASVTVECGSTYTDAGATALDTCAGDLTSSIVTVNPVNTSTPGSYTVTYNVSDGTNAAAQVTRTVTVSDTTDPVLTLNGQASVTIQCGSTYTDAGGTATDSCDNSVTVTNNAATTVDASSTGTYTVTVTATDDSGNTDTKTRTVTVVDSIKPVIALTGSASVTVECGSTYTDAGATAQDGCDGDLTGAITSNAAAVDTTSPGTYTISYNVVDGAGNAASTVTRTVTVADTTDPVLTLNGAAASTIECGDSYTELGATATDGCDGDITNSIVIAGDVVDTATPGTYVVSYTVADNEGNSSSASRTVTVADTTAPVITLNGSDTVTIACGDSYSDDGATATDSCDSAATVTVDASGVNSAVAGSYTVTITAEDASGNTASASRTVVVEDTVAPVVTLIGDASVTISCLDGSYTDAGATATDACEGDLVPVANGQVQVGSPGTYTITYSATDSSGNIGTASRTVVVVDDCSGPCDDANNNGIADDIFACLDTDGESLVLNVDGGTCTRRVYAETWFGDIAGSDIAVVVANPNDPNQIVTVSVGRDVIGAGQQAVLVVSISCTLEDLLGDEAFNLGTTPDGEVAGNAWFDVTIVVSNDGGATYDKLDNSILAGNPVTISINGLAVTPGSTPGLQSYSTTVANGDNGTQIFALVDNWSGDDNDCAYDAATGTLTCEVSSLSVFGAFEEAEPAAVIEVTPNPAFDFIVGIARPQESVNNTITVKNVGGGTLAGAGTINDPNGVFSLVGDATYSLAGGASDTITVRFAPAGKKGDFTATLTLTNSAGAPVTVTLKASSRDFIKNIVLFGCGADNATGGIGADLAVVALALGGLLLSSRSFRRSKQS